MGDTRHRFDLFVSEFVTAEASLGDPDAARRRMEIIEPLPKLEVTTEVSLLGQTLVSKGPIPKKAHVDAFHIAVAAVNGMDYLLTWNCKHIANAAIRLQIQRVCRLMDYESPVICTPLELSEE